jgi:hypothetical protein
LNCRASTLRRGTTDRRCCSCGAASSPASPHTKSAESDTLVVRADPEEREWLIEDAPAIYYLTDYYRAYPLVLARISRLDREALRDLLTASWRLTLPKTRTRPTRPAAARDV